ncbi:unknow (plasmid) [Vibrio campbellii]|nr:unknow [Vibrio campbellii]
MRAVFICKCSIKARMFKLFSPNYARCSHPLTMSNHEKKANGTRMAHIAKAIPNERAFCEQQSISLSTFLAKRQQYSQVCADDLHGFVLT